MSTPANPDPNRPQLGGYYGTPPPTPPRTNAGCFKIAGITCGSLLLMLVVVILISIPLARPMWRSFMKSARVRVQVKDDAASVWGAIQRYRTVNDRYPDNLAELAPKFIPDTRALHSNVDPNTDPRHISWKYTKPAASAPPSTTILEQDFKLKIPVNSNSAKDIPTQTTVSVDGDVETHP